VGDLNVGAVNAKIGADVSGYKQAMVDAASSTKALGDASNYTTAQLVELAKATADQREKLLEQWAAANDAAKGINAWTEAQQRAAMAMSGAHDQATKLNEAMDHGKESAGAWGEELLKMAGGGAVLAGGVALGIAALEGLKEITIGSVESFVAFGHSLELLHTKIDVPLEFAAAWKQTESVTGVSAERMASSLAMMDSRLAQGSKQALSAVNDLGISLEELRASAPQEQLHLLADGMQRLEATGQKADVVVKELFGGRIGLQMLPTLTQHAQELRDRIMEINGPLEQQVASAERYEAASALLLAHWEAIKRKLTEPLVGGMASFFEEIDKRGLGSALGKLTVGGGLGSQEGVTPPGAGPHPGEAPWPGFSEVPGGFSQSEWDAHLEKRQKALEKANAKALAEQKKFNDAEFQITAEAHRVDEAEQARWHKADDALDKEASALTLSSMKDDEKDRTKIRNDEIKHANDLAQASITVDALQAGAEERLAQAYGDRGRAIDMATEKTVDHLYKLAEHIAADKNLTEAERQLLLAKLALTAATVVETGAQQKLVEGLHEIGTALQHLSADLGGAATGWGQTFSTLGSIVDSFGAKTLTTMGKVAAAINAVGTAVNIYQGDGSTAPTMGAGAAKGAAAGAQFGWVGALVGGLAGGFIGLMGEDRVMEEARKAGMALGRTVSTAYAYQLEQGAKAAGMTFDEFVEKMRQEEALNTAIQKRKDIEQGLGTAQTGLAAITAALPNLVNTPELQAAIATITGRINDAMGASGLGYLASGPLKDSKAYAAAQAAAGGAAQVDIGMRQAGFVDQKLTEAMGGLASDIEKQAYAAAIAAGLSPTEATKAGFGAIVPILTQQLNDSLATGQKMDAKTQELIDTAKANGINIVGDPLILANSKADDRLAKLEEIRLAILHILPGQIEYPPPPPPPGGDPTRGQPDWIDPKTGYPRNPPPGYPPNLPWPPAPPEHHAMGGYIPARPGGTLGILGEGGEGEYVIPESKMGAMGGGGAMHFDVHLDDQKFGTIVVNTIKREAYFQNGEMISTLRRAVIGRPTL
jgi:hypothetical protein